MVNLIELPINAIEAAEDTPFLADYFSNISAVTGYLQNCSERPIGDLRVNAKLQNGNHI